MINRSVDILVVESRPAQKNLMGAAAQRLPGVGLVSLAEDLAVAAHRLAARSAQLVLVDAALIRGKSLEYLLSTLHRHPGAVFAVTLTGLSADPEPVRLARQAGSVGMLVKPVDPQDAQGIESFSRALSGMVKSVQAVNISRASKAAAQARECLAAPKPQPGPPARVVAIAISTGGPAALMQVVPLLPADLGVPVCVVQHMPPDFTAALAESLARVSGLAVKEAEDNEPLLPGRVYLAPGGRHLRAAASNSGAAARAVLDDGPPVNSCKPAADVLFPTLPPIFGPQVLAVVMTGMGNDGLRGVRAIKQAGGRCLTQCEADCTIYGMPRVVDEEGLSDQSLPLTCLARAITREVRGR